MTTMSQETIYSALYASLALTDSVLQIWITLTFAVIVATYFAGKHFERSVCLLVSGLYAFASLILALRFAGAAFQAFHYKNLLVTRGFGPWPVPHIVSVIIGGGSLLLIFAGTIGTLWFVRYTWKRAEVENEA